MTASANQKQKARLRQLSAGLFQEAVIESIVFSIGQQLFFVATDSVPVATQESCDLAAVLLGKDRTGCVKEFPARFHHRPQGLKDTRLSSGKADDIFRAAQPFGIRIAPRHTAGGARHIRQHRVEGDAVPPFPRLGAVGRLDPCLEAEAFQVAGHPPAAGGLQVEGEEVQVGPFQQVGRLAPRGGTGIENPATGRRVEQLGGPLRPQILDRNHTGGEIRQPINGGREKPFEGEKRILVPSPKVATYDLAPQMSALEVADRVVRTLALGLVDIVIVNLANPDMVGHTGVMDAVLTALRVVDIAADRIVSAAIKAGGFAVVTADHGNAESMLLPDGTPQTAHSANKVPFAVVGRGEMTLQNGRLCDAAPTLLALMGLPVPPEMDGDDLSGGTAIKD